MKAEMRSTMQTVARVQVFNLAHPVTDPGLTPVIADFDQRVARADTLITQQSESAARSVAANRARRAVRKRLVEGLLRLFASFFDLATEELPDLRGIRAPNLRTPDPNFVPAAERIVGLARTHLDALSRHGLTEVLLDEAAGLLEQYRTISDEGREAFQARIEASRALDESRVEIVGAIRRLDRLNRHRFAAQPDILAGWDAARNVITRPPRSKDTGPAGEPVEETKGDVADAAA